MTTELVPSVCPCDGQKQPNAEPTVKSILLKRRFLSLIVTKFFGAANDNTLKGVLIYMVIKNGGGVWDSQLGEGGQGIVGCVAVEGTRLFLGESGLSWLLSVST